jgi:hypothetical protein
MTLNPKVLPNLLGHKLTMDVGRVLLIVAASALLGAGAHDVFYSERIGAYHEEEALVAVAEAETATGATALAFSRNVTRAMDKAGVPRSTLYKPYVPEKTALPSRREQVARMNHMQDMQAAASTK